MPAAAARCAATASSGSARAIRSSTIRSAAGASPNSRSRPGSAGAIGASVPFLDGGNISTSPLPKFDNLRFGAGIGVRYHTRFGPIRVDVGTPLNPRSGDCRVAVYVSLGQAF